MNFTIEEENFECIFDVSSRTAAINEITAALFEINEPELREIADNVLQKLNDMSDSEFSALTFNLAYFDDDTEG